MAKKMHAHRVYMCSLSYILKYFPLFSELHLWLFQAITFFLYNSVHLKSICYLPCGLSLSETERRNDVNSLTFLLYLTVCKMCVNMHYSR